MSAPCTKVAFFSARLPLILVPRSLVTEQKAFTKGLVVWPTAFMPGKTALLTPLDDWYLTSWGEHYFWVTEQDCARDTSRCRFPAMEGSGSLLGVPAARQIVSKMNSSEREKDEMVEKLERSCNKLDHSKRGALNINEYWNICRVQNRINVSKDEVICCELILSRTHHGHGTYLF